MKFLRQFAAVVAVVAVVVLGGLAWNHFAPSLPGEGPAGQSPAGHVFVVRGRVVKTLPGGGKLPADARPARGGAPGTMRNEGSGIPSLMAGALLEPVNLAVLRQTAFIEAAVIAAIVILDMGYRRLRRARRAKT